MNKKVIIFDLDGTLIDSSPDLALAINHMLTTLNRSTFSSDTIHYWVGNGALMLVKRALSGQTEVNENLDETLVNHALEIFLNFYAKNLAVKTVTYPKVPETLDALKKHGYTLAIATNKPFAFVEPILKALEIKDFFETHLGGDSLSQKKPHPMPLLHLCQLLDVSVNECVMVGDSKNDILAANACKMQSIALSYGYNYGEDIQVHNPDVVFDSFDTILSTLIH